MRPKLVVRVRDLRSQVVTLLQEVAIHPNYGALIICVTEQALALQKVVVFDALLDSIAAYITSHEDNTMFLWDVQPLDIRSHVVTLLQEMAIHPVPCRYGALFFCVTEQALAYRRW